MTETKIYIAVDTSDMDLAHKSAALAADADQGIKLGLEFFNNFGPQSVQEIKENNPNASIFLDVKFHDIPNTVRGAAKAVSKLGIDYLNVHASGGMEMMKYALEGAQEGAEAAGIKPPKVLAVTVLTSLDGDDLSLMGVMNDPSEQVLRMAQLTKDAGLSGVVCSAHEIQMLRRQLGGDFVLMVPGIRPAGADADDQKRVKTPAEAISDGATHLVIGRPITSAQDPAKTLSNILDSI